MTPSRAAGGPKQPTPARKFRERLDEAEATLDAIATGRVDALVVSGPRGARTLTIEGGSHPYFGLLDAMSDGAALLTPKGEVLFANRGLGSMTGTHDDALRGTLLEQMVIPAERGVVEAFLREGRRQMTSGEFSLGPNDQTATPVTIALSALTVDAAADIAGSDARGDDAVLMAIITNLTYRKAAEETRTRLLERLISAEDEERRRVARELHDEAGQSLTAIMVGLRAIADMRLSAGARTAVLHLRDVAMQTVDDIGRLARGLHPAILDDKGLAAAATRYVADFARAFGVAVEVTMGRLDSPRLAPMTAATMYRILQECLTNVARHAHAKRAVVELRRDRNGLELVVRDDGVGFETSRASDGALGLRGMRERVALSHGSIEVESSPGHGAIVRVRLPIDGAVARRKRPHVATRPPPSRGR